jgi:hypothetical protein
MVEEETKVTFYGRVKGGHFHEAVLSTAGESTTNQQEFM